MESVKKLLVKLFIKPIDKSGEWWLGFSPFHLEEYLCALVNEENGYPIGAFRLAKCECGSDKFLLFADRDQGVARRICIKCKNKHFICDSEEFWKEASPTQWKCIECGSKYANIGVGFSLHDDGEVRWIYVGQRCIGCNVLGEYVDWKIDYGPSKQLLDQV